MTLDTSSRTANDIADTFVDAKARRLIKTALDSTMVVEAAAGTGKTSALISRVVALLESGRADAEEIVCITFTEKAAAELRARLRQARSEPAQVAELTLMHVGTIHGFCAEILRRYPIEADLDPLFSVCDESQAEDILREAFDHWYQRALSNPGTGLRQMLLRAHGRSPYEVLFRALRTLDQHRDFDKAWAKPRFERHIAIDSMVTDLDALGKLHAHAEKPNDYLARALRQIDTFSQELHLQETADQLGSDTPARNYDAIEASLSTLLKNRGAWTWKGYGNYGKGHARNEILHQRDQTQKKLTDLIEHCDAAVAADLQAELGEVVAAAAKLRHQRGLVDFLDLLLKTEKLIACNKKARAELKQTYRYFFLDEFQDTDPVQTRIVLALCRDDDSASVRPGSLFIVGDPKQSIYGFRRANLANYHDTISKLAQDASTRCLTLQTNFRSRTAICRMVNHALGPLMQKQHGIQADYVPLEPCPADKATFPSVVALPVPEPYGQYGKLYSGAVAASTPTAVAQFVRYLVDESGMKVAGRAVKPNDIALLFRGFHAYGSDRAARYVAELEKRGIDCAHDSKSNFYAREEISTFIALLNAIEWPEERYWLHGALSGPYLSGLFGDDLLSNASEVLTYVSNHTENGTSEVISAHARLRSWHQRRNDESLSRFLAMLMDELQINEACALFNSPQEKRGRQMRQNLEKFLDIARDYEGRYGGSFRAFLSFLANEHERATRRAQKVPLDNGNAVSLLTVHGAKGLEFPIVVLCDPTHGDEKGGRIFSDYLDSAKGHWAGTIAGLKPRDLLEKREHCQALAQAEELRLAYVAATRARDLLVVPCVGDGKVAGWVSVFFEGLYPKSGKEREARPVPGAPSFGNDSVVSRPTDANQAALTNIKPGLHAIEKSHYVAWWDPKALNHQNDEKEAAQRPPAPVLNGTTVESAVAEIADALERWNAERQETLARGRKTYGVQSTVSELRSRTIPDLEQFPVTILQSTADKENRPRGPRFGTLVHAAFNSLELKNAQSQIDRHVGIWSRTLGANQEEYDAAIAALHAALAHPLITQALTATNLRREAPVFFKKDEQLVEGSIDLVFYAQNSWVVVDFKTDLTEGMPNNPARASEYETQIRLYASAIKEATGQDVRCVLFGI